MTKTSLGIADYPLAEKRPELIAGARGKALADLTVDAVLAGTVAMEDLRITATALSQQAEIARSAGRPRLADNFERAAELVDVPQDLILQVYELLRPGRAASAEPLMAAAQTLRETYGATRMAAFVEEAATVYAKRGLFTRRY
jgi:propanediol dehydratase small subunit